MRIIILYSEPNPINFMDYKVTHKGIFCLMIIYIYLFVLIKLPNLLIILLMAPANGT